MKEHIRPTLVLLGTLTALTGVVYPLAVTGIAQAAFPQQANGSLISRGKQQLGSTLIGQPVSDPKYFWGRASATAPFSHNAASSSGSNLGPTNPALLDAVKARIKALREADPENDAKIPIDLVTSSASGLDPHISPAAAEYQTRRVARVRGMSEAAVRRLVAEHTEGRQLGVFGQPRINVLLLNRALDSAR
jgi:potassium-transporting ATPase KdpC subunit